jgi:desampylase
MSTNDSIPALRLSAAALLRLRMAALRALPHECCGALLGCGGRTAEVRRVLRVPNRAPDPRGAYLILPEAVLRIESAATRAGFELLGFFHSHPDGSAEPSRRDLASAWPGYLYVIVPAGGAPTAWRLAEDRSRFRPLDWRVAA